jgi:hypothetical protein
MKKLVFATLLATMITAPAYAKDHEHEDDHWTVPTWKLFATVLAISDTGSVSVSSIATDFVDRGACEAAAHDLFPGTVERDVQGHRITIRAAADCRPDGSGPPPPPPPPFFFGR